MSTVSTVALAVTCAPTAASFSGAADGPAAARVRPAVASSAVSIFFIVPGPFISSPDRAADGALVLTSQASVNANPHSKPKCGPLQRQAVCRSTFRVQFAGIGTTLRTTPATAVSRVTRQLQR